MSDSVNDAYGRFIEAPVNVYGRFIEEMEALSIAADRPAVWVVGELTRAAKRAQMVADGELLPVAHRKDTP